MLSSHAIVLTLGLLFGAASEELAVVVERNVAVPMRDGVVLRADVFRPDHGGPYPVLVMRTPYGKQGHKFDRYVKAGYIIVCQDARGRFQSDGQWESFVRFELPAAGVFALMLYPMLRGDLRISKNEGLALLIAFLAWVAFELLTVR